MRFGRNVARTFFEYYRFTNVLAIPMVNEMSSRKGRPKTHRPRGRSRIRSEVQTRPKTTRVYAPISYTDLSIRYDSSTSNEGSPVRHTHFGYGFGTRSSGNIYMNQDQFSLLAIQQSKFNNLDFTTNECHHSITELPKLKVPCSTATKRQADILNVPPKPSLSIIDFNQLTRGGLEMARKRLNEEKKRNNLQMKNK